VRPVRKLRFRSTAEAVFESIRQDVGAIAVGRSARSRRGWPRVAFLTGPKFYRRTSIRLEDSSASSTSGSTGERRLQRIERGAASELGELCHEAFEAVRFIPFWKSIICNPR
jgi:hypothetical protein